jgi:hypothetical protein
MAYDSSLDEQLFAKSWEGDGTKLTVAVYSYNRGQKKVQISRELTSPDGQPGFAKLGRLTKEELQAILPLLQEALTRMG